MEAIGGFLDDVGPDILFNLAAVVLFYTFARLAGARGVYATAFALTPLFMSMALAHGPTRDLIVGVIN